MSDNRTPLSEDERDDLVAYLDGELTGDAAQAIESKLSLDPRYRAEAAALKQTWEMLDFLPKSEASPSFSHQTVSRIVPGRPSGSQPKAPSRWRARVFGVGWAAAVLLAGIAGYTGMNAFYPRDTTDEDLSRDLRVIENKHYYEHVDNIDFLWQLDHPDLFGDDRGG